VLDDGGVFSVFAGLPHQPSHYRIYATSIEDDVAHDSYFSRFYLHLSSTGELAVLRVGMAGAREEAECVWSSTHCNRVLALVREYRVRGVLLIRSCILLL
jgi:hypothetical protein